MTDKYVSCDKCDREVHEEDARLEGWVKRDQKEPGALLCPRCVKAGYR